MAKNTEEAKEGKNPPKINLADCRVCGSTFAGKPGEKAPDHNSGSKGQRCPGSQQAMIVHVPK